MTEGWIKIYRKFLDWGWYKHSDTKNLFIHLLIIANNQDNEWNHITVKRGQCITSLPHLSRDTGISIQSIRTCINRLKSTGEITDKSTNKFRLITIINYDTYQSQKDITNRQTNRQTNIQLTGNQQATNSKQEVKKERSIYSVLFENFWKAYPRKIGKEPANKSWVKISISEEVYNQIMAGLANYIKHEWKGKEMKYIPHAATWLNQERWKDEVTIKKEDSDYL